MSANNVNAEETIVAQATPSGRGGIGVVRISGPLTLKIAQTILGKVPKPRYAHFASFINAKNQQIDHGIALYFPAPNSFTGEDILELHGHGGPVVIDQLIHRCLELGATLARPGEFSERAFLNHKIDLTQAEAISDLINATSTQAANSALRSLSGEFAALVHALVERIINLRMYVEAAIDFSEEEISFLERKDIVNQLQTLIAEIAKIQTSAKQGTLLREGVKIVIAGKPNVGKSSLLNRLCNYDCAIVSAIPGTTRDVLREYINFRGLPIHVVDTAGIRQSTDDIELEGIKRALNEVQNADFVLLLTDEYEADLSPYSAILSKIIIVRNKIDLIQQKAQITKYKDFDVVNLSVKTGDGIDLLEDYLCAKIGFNSNLIEGTFLARRRHLTAITKAEQSLQNALTEFIHNSAFELCAEELRQSQQALNEITGEFYTDDLLAKIFSTFCVGK